MRFYGLLVCFVLLLTAGCSRSEKCEKEIYLLPYGFHGRMMVFFDRKDGLPVEYEGNARLYRIPPGGLLKSQFPRNGGCMNNGRIEFFYLDSLGNRKPLLYFLDMAGKKIPSDSSYVLFSLLSNKGSRMPFVIHLVGNALEFQELTREVRKKSPEAVLKGME